MMRRHSSGPSYEKTSCTTSSTRAIMGERSDATTSTSGTAGMLTPMVTPYFNQQPVAHHGPSPYSSATYPLAPNWMSPIPLEGTIPTDSPALKPSKESIGSDSYFTETARGTLPRRHETLKHNAAHQLGQLLGLGLDPDSPQTEAEENVAGLPEWPILVEWLCNNQPVHVFRDISGLFSFTSFTASTPDQTISPARPTILSTTNVHMDLTWAEILERLEQSRTITGGREGSRSRGSVIGLHPSPKFLLAFKSLKLKFDMAGGKHGEIDLAAVGTQELRDVWKLVLRRGLRDHLVVEYAISGKYDPGRREINKSTTKLRKDDGQKSFQAHQSTAEMHGALGATSGFRAKVKSAFMDMSPKKSVGSQLGRVRSLRRSLGAKQVQRKRDDEEDFTAVV